MDLLHGQTLSYPGWEADKAEAEKLCHCYTSDFARKKLIGMKNKQRLFDGDRSHPDIVSLDNTMFTYDGWQEDKKEAEQFHTATSPLPGVPFFGSVQDKVNAMKKKQTAHSNRSSVAFLRELDSQTFSYTGWQADKKEAEKMYHENLSFASTKLMGMKNKQRLFAGDRSHPEIVALDTATFTYQGWQEDKKVAERIHTATTIIFGIPYFDTVENKLTEMKRKQAMHSNRSNIPFLHELDSCTFSYNGWQADKAEAETFHQTGSSFAPKKLIGMKNKQRLLVHLDRSHPELVTLDNTIFTYNGWQEDKKEAEKIHTATSIVRGIPIFGTVQGKVNEMKKKQTMHSNRSSVAFLRDLDSILPRQRQAPAPPQQQQQQQPPPPPPAAAAAQPPQPRRTALLECSRHVKRVCSETTRTKVKKDDDNETDKTKDDTNHCVICMECEPTHAYIPCGHRCVCANCASSVGNTTSLQRAGGELKCPVCRVTAMCVTKIFL